jgi:predicted dehydrogenase
MADPVRVAVVGSGYFGRFHADHYARNKRAELVAVIDTDEDRARAVAKEFAASSAASMPPAWQCRRRSTTTSRGS